VTEVGLAFLAGLAGSLHCIGMCGGIAAAVALAGERTGTAARHLQQLLYNLGRITTYTIMGAVAGWLGASLDLFAIRQVSLWFFVGANVFVMLVGIFSLLQMGRLGMFALESTTGRFLTRPVRSLLSGDSPLRFYPLGILLGFLPCGLVYAPLVTAAASGTVLAGGAIMLAIGLGTLPVMMTVGSCSALVSARLRGMFHRLAGLFVAMMGGAGLWRVLAKMDFLPPFPF
jgi:hypothetical protein